MTLDDQKNKFLTETVMKECWHRASHNLMGSSCVCGNIFSRCPGNHDFSTPEGFFKLWNAMQKRDDFDGDDNDFLPSRCPTDMPYYSVAQTYLINPPVFRDAVCEFLGFKEVDE